jgi:hypothetical protein
LLGAPTKSKLEPRQYDPTKFPPSKAEYPMNQIRACVDVLLADGKIAIPKVEAIYVRAVSWSRCVLHSRRMEVLWVEGRTAAEDPRPSPHVAAADRS